MLILMVLRVVAFGQLVSDSLVFEGHTRSYYVYAPPDFQPGLPLVLNLPCYDCSAIRTMEITRMVEVADTANFVLVFPEAIQQRMNSGLGDHPWFPTPDVDDVGFLSELIDTLFAVYAIDTSRVYSMGMSNGGMMSFRLAGDLNHRIKKVASIVGGITPTIANSLDNAPQIPVMFFLGTDDPILPFAGDDVFYSGQEIVDLWVDHNQSITTMDSLPLPDLSSDDHSTLTLFQYNGESAGQQTIYIRMEGAGHTIPSDELYEGWGYLGTQNLDMVAAQFIWRFFNSDTFAVSGVWATGLNISSTYISPESQNFTATATIINTQSHDYAASAVLFNQDTTAIDSFLFFDDGLHADGSENDGFAAAPLTSPMDEGFYTLRLTAEDLESGEYCGHHKLARFPTAGPLTVQSLDHLHPAQEAIPPGQTVYFDLFLENLGSETTIGNISAEITPTDTNSLAVGGYTSSSFSDIAAGEIQLSLRHFALQIKDDCPEGTPINFKVALKSDGMTYWEEERVLLGTVAINNDGSAIPREFSLQQNYPNPFNPFTTISYDLPEFSDVKLTVYDVTGRELTTLRDQVQTPGHYEVQWNGMNASGIQKSTGVYFARLRAGEYNQTIKMLYLK